jgi:hypothetical protein
MPLAPSTQTTAAVPLDAAANAADMAVSASRRPTNPSVAAERPGAAPRVVRTPATVARVVGEGSSRRVQRARRSVDGAAPSSPGRRLGDAREGDRRALPAAGGNRPVSARCKTTPTA